MKNLIYFGDNLKILKKMPSESVDLIYIEPPFNTNKTQKRTTIKTIQDKNGDRKGFKGITYRTVELGTKSYDDSFDNSLDSHVYIYDILKPRLVEAYRLLKSHGSLYFHIDYREVHYCKILLDEIFGRRECFLNEIIWAYDYGGRAKSRWPAKHDNILFYVKDPQNYVFNIHDIDREPYMAPGLVGPEKAKKRKLPTDTWWPRYVGAKITKPFSDTWWLNYAKGQNATWWQTIVPTNGKERMGYPTQKPRKLLDRIIKASSNKGDVVLDFFAGSGTTGESSLELGRNFVLIDKNKAALEVMAQRFAGNKNIEWINFDPKPYQTDNSASGQSQEIELPKIGKDFIMLAAMASHMQQELEDEKNPWENSAFEWILSLPPRKKGKLGGKLVTSWLASKGIQSDSTKDSSEKLQINDLSFAIKFSTLWANDIYKFQQIRPDGYDYVICLGISPFKAHCWILERKYAIKHAKPQHKSGKVADYWIEIDPQQPKDWIKDYGGTLDQAYSFLKNLLRK